MATVFLAHDNTLDREVAVKILNHDISEQPDQLQRFDREARDMAKLSHPHVVGVIDAGEDNGRRYIVFEYVEGETLKHRIRRLGQLPVDEATAYAIEIARGLQAAHVRKLVHRDVKPQNVLIDLEGRAKLTDFGIARTLGSAGTTATGKVLGTTDYVSPEQAMGEEVDERSDIYSLGVLLYEMLTGDVPFHGETMVAVAMKHVNEDLPNIQLMRPQVSSALAAVIERATAKDPRRRYRHLAEMLDDLENALEVEVSRSGPSHGEVTSVLESVPRQRRLLEGRGASRAGVVMGAIGLALIVVVIAVTGGGVRGGGTISLRAHSAHSFDPPPGDGTEHPEATGLAVDGNPSGTPWQTETYPAPDFGGIKDGVGLYLDVGKEVQAHSMQVRTPVSGWSAELRAASGSSPPTSLNDWKIVGGSESVKSGDKIDIEAPGDYRFYMLWITRLAPAEGGYRVTVNDIKLGR